MRAIEKLERVYYSWRPRKYVGMFFLISSFLIACFVAYQFVASGEIFETSDYPLLENSSLAAKVMLLAIFGLILMASYNWLIGPQKGHFFHFVMTVVTFGFSVLLLFIQEARTTYGGILAFYTIIVFSLRRKYSAAFRRDRLMNIRHDYFQDGSQA